MNDEDDNKDEFEEDIDLGSFDSGGEEESKNDNLDNLSLADEEAMNKKRKKIDFKPLFLFCSNCSSSLWIGVTNLIKFSFGKLPLVVRSGIVEV